MVKKSVLVILILGVLFSFVQLAIADDSQEVFRAVRANAGDVPKDLPNEKFCAFDFESKKQICIDALNVDYSNNEFFITPVPIGSTEPDVIRYSLEYGFVKKDFKPPKNQNLKQAKESSNQNKPVALRVEVGGEEKNILISKKNKDTVFESSGVSVQTSKSIQIDSKGLKIEGQIINVLPEKAVQKIVGAESKVIEKNISLDIENTAPVYTIEAKIEGKLFGIIPLEVPVNAKVDAKSGEVREINKPFWVGLVK